MFIGQGNLTKDRILPTFRVRRWMVHRALYWLKEHNEDYYRDISIDDERLRNLPIDDVPEEVMSIIKHTNDVGLVAQESDGYVHEDEETEENNRTGQSYRGGCDNQHKLLTVFQRSMQM